MAQQNQGEQRGINLTSLQRTRQKLQNDLRIVDRALAIATAVEGMPDTDDVLGDVGPQSGTVTKRRPGRPKGSKNRSTTVRRAAKTGGGGRKVAAKQGRKRGPGRPKGSKNKPANGGGDETGASNTAE